MEYLLIFISAIFVNNIVLSQFLGICPFLGVSKKIDTAIGMGWCHCLRLDLGYHHHMARAEVCARPIRFAISPDLVVHPRDCGIGADG